MPYHRNTQLRPEPAYVNVEAEALDQNDPSFAVYDDQWFNKDKQYEVIVIEEK